MGVECAGQAEGGAEASSSDEEGEEEGGGNHRGMLLTSLSVLNLLLS